MEQKNTLSLYQQSFNETEFCTGTIRHIVFDFGGVILDLEGKTTVIPDSLVDLYNITYEDAVRIWKENNFKLIKGQETPRQFFERINNQLSTDIDIDKSIAKWGDIFSIHRENINWDLIEYIRELGRKYNLYILSDTIDISHGADEWIHEVEEPFQKIFKSYEEQLRKPETAAFENVLSQINAYPHECVFIDDVEENVSVARELGIQGIQYINLDKLRSNLDLMGVISDQKFQLE